MLAFAASCLLDTKPITDGSASAAGPQAVEMSWAPSTTPVATSDTPDAGRDSAIVVPPSNASSDAGSAIVTTPPPTASSGMADAGMPAAMTPSVADAGITKPPAASCSATGSYGLRAALDVTWDSTAWFDVGRGTAELYGVVHVESIDPQAQTVSAHFQACGLSLPALNSNALCSRYQLQLPANVWDDGKLPQQRLDGTYSCDGSKCSLQFMPLSYAMGIKLADVNGPWPELEDTSPAQFADDDGDGLPGVTVDVISAASLSGQNACTTASVPTGPTSSGPGNGGNGNGGNGKSGPQTPVTTAAPPAPIGGLQLGLRTQLTAAMELTSDCKLHEVKASGAALDLRSAGCFVMDGVDPTSANAGCSEELRANFDATLPHYVALEKGEAPSSSSGPGPAKPADKRSEGTLLKAIRFAPGTQVTCEQLRNSKL
jgi:hypothetical protein